MMKDQRWNELRDLIDAFIEGELAQEEAERLAVWLSIDDEAQSVYLHSLQLHAELTLAFNENDSVVAGIVPEASLRESFLTRNQLNVTSSGVVSKVTSLECSSAKPRSRLVEAVCRRLTAVSGSVTVACFAVMLAVVAVFGSERLISEVLSARRASMADEASGLLASRGRDEESIVLRKANPESGTRRVGSSGHAGVALASVFLFPLPPLQELERIESARLEWTYKTKDGDPQFSVDLYGLGFIEPGSLSRLNFWEGPNDTSSRAAYGMAGSSERRVALLKRGALSPQTSCGRVSIENRDLVRFLQSLYDDGAQEGDLAVFRLNADSPTSQIERETGYAVVHPPSNPGLTRPEELPTLIVTARSQWRSHEQVVAEAVMTAHSVSEHWSGGLVRSFNNLVQAGCNMDGTRRVGSSQHEGVGLVNVFVFSLPPIENLEDVVSAQLQWTCISKDNAPNFSADLYGLGYVRGESYHGPCFWEGTRDTASPADYSLRGGPKGRVSLIARRAMGPTTPCGRVVIENAELLKFLRSLYDDGAQEGDLVVFRLNADVSTLDIARSTGYAIVHAPEVPGKTAEADLPVLLMTFN